jgi:putative hydrolase
MPHQYFFGNLKVLPQKLHGVFLFRGVELNIMNEAGEVDLKPVYIKPLDFVMAGFHEACFKPASVETNTQALVATIANPLVDAISHPGNGVFPIDMETVVKAAVKHGKALEINNSSFRFRSGSNENCRALAALCKKHGSLISCGSDAHYHSDVGNFDIARPVIEEAGIDADHLINSSLARFLDFVNKRKAARFNL